MKHKIIKASVAALVIGALVTGGDLSARATSDLLPMANAATSARPAVDAAPPLARCALEDGSGPQDFPCAWDASSRGNWRGTSYILVAPGQRVEQPAQALGIWRDTEQALTHAWLANPWSEQHLADSTLALTEATRTLRVHPTTGVAAANAVVEMTYAAGSLTDAYRAVPRDPQRVKQYWDIYAASYDAYLAAPIG